MPAAPGPTATAAVRFVLVKELPLVAVDLEPSDVDGPPLLLRDSLYRLLVERGLVELPRFYDVDLPRGVRVGLTVAADQLRLEDHEETVLLRVPRREVDPAWLGAALTLRGTMLVVGTSLGVGPEHDAHEVCDLLDLAAAAGRAAGAIVGVAEPVQGLPLVFG